MSENKFTDTLSQLLDQLETVKTEIEKQNARMKQLEASNKELLEELEAEKQFIQNGIQYGYINMPDKDCGDSALETPAKIEAAIQKARGVQQ